MLTVNSLFGETETVPEFGTEPKFFARREDPDTSHEAAQSIDTSRLEQMVLDAISSFGDEGCISDEVLDRFPGFAYSSVTGRLRMKRDEALAMAVACFCMIAGFAWMAFLPTVGVLYLCGVMK